MKIKILLILILLTATSVAETDFVMHIYNTTCFETPNIEYVWIAGIEWTNLTVGEELEIHQLRKMGPKAIFAEIKVIQ